MDELFGVTELVDKKVELEGENERDGAGIERTLDLETGAGVQKGGKAAETRTEVLERPADAKAEDIEKSAK